MVVVRIEWNDMAQSRSRSLILLPWVGYAVCSNSTLYSVKMQTTTLYNYATVTTESQVLPLVEQPRSWGPRLACQRCWRPRSAGPQHQMQTQPGVHTYRAHRVNSTCMTIAHLARTRRPEALQMSASKRETYHQDTTRIMLSIAGVLRTTGPGRVRHCKKASLRLVSLDQSRADYR